VIVMKFGGTSVADADRIRGIAEIVRSGLDRRPVVVVSALAGVTDLLVRAEGEARGGGHEAVEPLLADLERRHRWALSGLVQTAKQRHHLGLEIDGAFEQLRQTLRSIRILGEASARTADSVFAMGETMSSTIVAAAFEEAGIPADWVDSRRVLLTDDRFGGAAPDQEQVTARAREVLAPLVARGRVPVLGGFVGATAAGETTTLGRGGSDTSAAVLGAALDAEEIQIWTDVDGLMSADPRLVPEARPIDRLSFVEASELAFYGARVLHPDCLTPAVRRGIPVRVLNSMDPAAAGTVVVDRVEQENRSPIVSVASRAGVASVTVVNRKRVRADRGFAAGVLAVLHEHRLAPELVVASELGVQVVVDGVNAPEALVEAFESYGDVEIRQGRDIICIVGSSLASPEERGRAVHALADWEPELLARRYAVFTNAT